MTPIQKLIERTQQLIRDDENHRNNPESWLPVCHSEILDLILTLAKEIEAAE